MALLIAADFVTSARDLLCNQPDASSTLAIFADQFLEDELPNLPNGWSAGRVFANVTAGTATVVSEDNLNKLLAVFHGSRELSHEPQSALDAGGATWPNVLGAPRAWTTDREQDRTIRLTPIPDVSSVGSVSHSATTNHLLFLYMGNTYVPKYLRLPGALWILSREYSRESRYRDMDLAKICQTLAERMINLVDGIVVDPNAKGQS